MCNVLRVYIMPVATEIVDRSRSRSVSIIVVMTEAWF